MYNPTGKKSITNTLSLDKGLNTVSLPVSSLPAGVYFVQVVGESGVLQGRLVKGR
ncbi:T9SS type A sorting domain-containing protein [Terrimonas ferruginea]|uniref:T9SS type A sorting domain-containing protein n=1 Tax=Terrimonas ferruginea TaxID=249 RepID=UPI0026EA70C3|nr:T9SS type A sorting domain-containing protein [Terrimonas ferruginea]